jgi:trans-2,3-dihydro-3-hydroxyanthranilate isomerase
MPRQYRYALVDVFTERALSGNPLAVFTNATELPGETMQALAREMNLSETAFVLPPKAGGTARIRIFTPTRELPFAGHPVLGTGFVLGAPLQRDNLTIETAHAHVALRLERDGPRVVFGWMEQPEPKLRVFSQQKELLEALGVEASELPIELYDNGAAIAYVALREPELVAALTPRRAALGRLPMLGCYVFAAGADFYKARFFAPSAGVDEDPATGSAAGPLAVHLARHGRIAFGAQIRIEQGAEVRRPSVLHAVAHRRDEQIAVEVGGAAVLVARGSFTI